MKLLCGRSPPPTRAAALAAAVLLAAVEVGVRPRSARGEAVPPTADALGFHADIQPLLRQHCAECHAGEEVNGGVRLDRFTDAASILDERSMWLRALVAVERGEMPPDPESSGFTRQDADRLVGWIRAKVETIDPANPLFLDPGPAIIRQLTPTEYRRSILEVLGFEFELEGLVGLGDQYTEAVFSNNARSLTMDPTTFDRYYDAAHEVLAQFFDDENGRWFKAGWQVANRRRVAAKAGRTAVLAEAEGKTDAEAARRVLRGVATRAFRRPVTDPQLDALMTLFDRETAAGGSFTSGLRKAMHPILTSPRFLFRIEGERDVGAEPFARLDDFELAARLSYFLWAAPPDRELMTLAEEGKLHDPAVLAGQVQRLLKDDRAGSLTDIFAVQWTQLHHLEKAVPERKHFPKWTPTVRDAAREEVVSFFHHLRREDRPVTDLIDADYTFVNKELAAVYGLPGVSGTGSQKVSLPAESPRGGLMGMTAFLAMTSHTNRTKPTARGKWILDVMYGMPPPPPPANVEALDDKAARDPALASLSFREQLNRHATEAACRGCHDRIDPLGFAMENFNGIGEWREKDGDKPVDNAGVLPSGRRLAGFADLKQVLLDDKEAFVANLTRKLLSYALGRNLVFSDELTVKQVTERAAAADYRFSAIIQGIVESRPFTMIRSVQPETSTASVD